MSSVRTKWKIHLKNSIFLIRRRLAEGVFFVKLGGDAFALVFSAVRTYVLTPHVRIIAEGTGMHGCASLYPYITFSMRPDRVLKN